jgi:hypothetical protein
LAPPSRTSSATMAVNLTIPQPARSFSPTVSNFACHVPILLSKMERPNVLFALLIILCAPFSFRRAFLQFTGSRLYTLPPTLSTGSPPKPSPSRHPTPISIPPNPPMTISKFLGVLATPTCPLQHPTNLHPAPPYACSSATLPTTKAIATHRTACGSPQPPRCAHVATAQLCLWCSVRSKLAFRYAN